SRSATAPPERGAWGPFRGPPLFNGQEHVADAADLVVGGVARAAVALATIPGGTVLGPPALLGAAVPDHLDVLGIGEGLAQVPIKVWSVPGHDEDLAPHWHATLPHFIP